MKRLFSAAILLFVFSLQFLPAVQPGNMLCRQQQYKELPHGNEVPQNEAEKNFFTELQPTALTLLIQKHFGAVCNSHNTALYALAITEVAVPPPR